MRQLKEALVNKSNIDKAHTGIEMYLLVPNSSYNNGVARLHFQDCLLLNKYYYAYILNEKQIEKYFSKITKSDYVGEVYLIKSYKELERIKEYPPNKIPWMEMDLEDVTNKFKYNL